LRRCYLGLGSNLCDRIGMISRAVRCLASHGGLAVARISSFYLSKPWGYARQDDFVNAVIEVHTYLEPLELLRLAKATEQLLGRKPRRRWGPREIDIDILLYESEIISCADLEIPHPRMCERGFVLAPLVEINSDLVHPATGRRFSSHLAELASKGEGQWQDLSI